MVQRCSVCSHPSRTEIERNLHEGVPYRTLALKFDLSTSALCRHAKHLARQRKLEQSYEVLAHQEYLLEKMALLDTRLDRLFNYALDIRSLNVALGCIRESLNLHSQATIIEQRRLALASKS